MEKTERDERADLAERIQNGEPDLIGQLWEMCERLACSVINRVLSSSYYYEKAAVGGVTDDDLKQEAFLAFYRATYQYKKRDGAKFSTFIFSVMNCGVRDYIRRKSRRQVESLDQPIAGEDDLLLVDTIADPDSEKPFEELTRREYIRRLRADLDLVLMDLGEKHRRVIMSRYYSNRNRDDTATALGLTPGYITQLESEALDTMRRHPALRDYMPRGYKEPEEVRQTVSQAWALAMLENEEE